MSRFLSRGAQPFGISRPHWKKSCLRPHIKYFTTHITKTSHSVSSKFTILCWATLIAILGCRLDTLLKGCSVKHFTYLFLNQRENFRRKKGDRRLYKCCIHEDFNNVHEENVDNPKSTMLSSNINHHPSTVSMFCIIWKMVSLCPARETVVPNFSIKIFVKLKNFIALKILLHTFSHGVRMEKVLF